MLYLILYLFVLDYPGFLRLSVAFRNNAKRRRGVYLSDPSAQWTSVDQCLERETRLASGVRPIEI